MNARTIPAMLELVRNPEYTGENRCYPCTFVNSLIAVGLAAGLAVLWIPAGVVALGIFGVIIYLWGYLVPGTPQLTQRYLPARVLRLFDKESIAVEATADGAGEREPKRDPEELLVTSGVVEECEDEADLCLTETFREVWWRRIRQFRNDEDRAAAELASVLEVDPAALTFKEVDDTFTVVFQGDSVAQWASDAAFYADLAVEPTLAEWLDNWREFGDHERTRLIAGMRVFLESCPMCEAALEPVEDVRSSCCSGELVNVSIFCEECGAKLVGGTYQ